ncbi:hypothetical protein GGI07_004788 [Coemansia sp. Benny D115]|nr:hypothetical protein GGI07_004788 [Coemansia sp. Benny D115]
MSDRTTHPAGEEPRQRQQQQQQQLSLRLLPLGLQILSQTPDNNAPLLESLPPEMLTEGGLAQIQQSVSNMWDQLARTYESSVRNPEQARARMRLNSLRAGRRQQQQQRQLQQQPQNHHQHHQHGAGSARRGRANSAEGWTLVNMRLAGSQAPAAGDGNSSSSSSSSPPRTRRRLSNGYVPPFVPPLVPLLERAGEAAAPGGFEPLPFDVLYGDGQMDDPLDVEATRTHLGSMFPFDSDDVDDDIEQSLWEQIDSGGIEMDADPASEPASEPSADSQADAALERLATMPANHHVFVFDADLSRLTREGLPSLYGASGRVPLPQVRGAAAQKPPLPQSHLVVRQPWSRDFVWRPHIHRVPIPQQPTGDSMPVRPSAKAYVLRENGVASPRLDILARDIRPLRFVCSNVDDASPHPTANLVAPNSQFFATTRARNVNIELTYAPESGRQRHCVVEHIRIEAPIRSSPPCVEIMVFASSRACSFAELKKYDDFTFAQYEQLSADLLRQGSGSAATAAQPDGKRCAPTDPLPIAYFWLARDDLYRQVQMLPRGVTCRYLYFKLLRGRRRDATMAIRLLRVYGWDGARAFSESHMC